MPRKSKITGNAPGKKIIKPQNARKIIRKYHVLLKQKAFLEKEGTKNSELDLELKKLQNQYQQASLSGQSSSRGGDSSRLLVEWLEEMNLDETLPDKKILEIGCLSVNNAIARKTQHIERIDLNPQDRRIIKQDFMERPKATNDSQKFDIVSCSLVLNYVADPETRGEMLKKMRDYILQTSTVGIMFLVLPTPCVDNSRYLTREHLSSIMGSLGYELLKEKTTEKVSYWCYKWSGSMASKSFKKKLINDGKHRNNFAITVQR